MPDDHKQRILQISSELLNPKNSIEQEQTAGNEFDSPQPDFTDNKLNSDQFLEFENFCQNLENQEVAFGQNVNLPEDYKDQKLL